MFILTVIVSFSYGFHIVNIDIYPLCQSIGLDVPFLVTDFSAKIYLFAVLNDEIMH